MKILSVVACLFLSALAFAQTPAEIQSRTPKKAACWYVANEDGYYNIYFTNPPGTKLPYGRVIVGNPEARKSLPAEGEIFKVTMPLTQMTSNSNGWLFIAADPLQKCQ